MGTRRLARPRECAINSNPTAKFLILETNSPSAKIIRILARPNRREGWDLRNRENVTKNVTKTSHRKRHGPLAIMDRGLGTGSFPGPRSIIRAVGEVVHLSKWREINRAYVYIYIIRYINNNIEYKKSRDNVHKRISCRLVAARPNPLVRRQLINRDCLVFPGLRCALYITLL